MIRLSDPKFANTTYTRYLPLGEQIALARKLEKYLLEKYSVIVDVEVVKDARVKR